jgi:hypothetical protein
MPVYKDFSNIKARILLWKYEAEEVFDARKLLEPENYDRKIPTIIPEISKR